VWQYVDLTLEDQHGLDAEAVLASLAGDRAPASLRYGLARRMDSYRQPNPDDMATVTSAGVVRRGCRVCQQWDIAPAS
jgi:hypothetical protein